MRTNDLIGAWKREERLPFSGWDFSHLAGRMVEEEPPWSYPARSAFDMGTGGGERLLALREHWPPRVVVTEDYAPNVRLATERLAPLGVRVVVVELSDDGGLPFAEGSFDLVLNRHSGLNPAEVGRVLAPGGTFLTQQVHGLWAHDLIEAFGARPQWPDAAPERYVPRLRAAGLTVVEAREWSGRLRFTDVGAIVYYLRAVPWLVPGFTVEGHVEHLTALQRRLDAGEQLSFVARKYLIEARKCAMP